MNYEPPFNLGDRVYHIVNQKRPHWIVCPMCRGAGEITVYDCTDRCPKCHGSKGRLTWEDEGWHVALTGWEDPENHCYLEGGFRMLTIGEIQMKHREGKPPEWVAMCCETGIGSGTLHSMTNFFATVEKAQVECDHRNASQNILEERYESQLLSTR